MNWEDPRKYWETHLQIDEAFRDLTGRNGRDAVFNDTVTVPLSEEKQKAVALLQHDYFLMELRFGYDTDAILFPEDEKAWALLKESRQKDLEKLLTSEELFEYEVRKSETALTLRSQLTLFKPTEEEFRDIFRIQQEQSRLAESDSAKKDEKLNGSVETDLRELLGERYQLYERSQDRRYEQLVGVTKRFGLPRERADQVYDLKDLLESEKRVLRENSVLSPENRNAAVRELEEEVRSGLTELLGERGLEAFRKNGGHYWLPRAESPQE